MKQYLDFDVRFSRHAGDAHWSIAISGDGGDAPGNFTPPGEESRALLERLARGKPDEEALTEFGELLFNALFKDQARHVYEVSQGRLTEKQGLRLRLIFPPDAAEIGALPWELLADPVRGHLALHGVAVMRYIELPLPKTTLRAEPPIAVLLTAAQTEPKVDVEHELEAVREALAGLGERVKVTVEPHLTRLALQRRLREAGGYHVWHFVGHGAIGRDGRTGVLRFEDASGDAETVSATELNALLSGSGVRLAVLNACESGRLTEAPMRSVGLALVRAQVPATVAMQFQVREASARAFAEEFYRALAEELPIDACVTEGRRAVLGASGIGRPDWAIPAVYTRARDGMLFAPKPAGASGDGAGGSRTTTTIGGNVTGPVLSGEFHGPVTIGAGQPQPTGGAVGADAEQLHRRLKTTRATLADQLLQLARLGRAYAPPGLIGGIREARDDIRKLKATLRAMGVSVADYPDDEE